MSGLTALKLVQSKREKGMSPQHARRQKLSTKLAEQIQMAKASSRALSFLQLGSAQLETRPPDRAAGLKCPRD